MTQGSPYRAALVKRRPVPVTTSSMAPNGRPEPVPATQATPSAADRAAAIGAEHARRVAAETKAVRRIETMTTAWNDELSSTVPAIASIVSRAVRSIVGDAPREDVVMTALRREVARVRGEHRPVLRVARSSGDGWVGRLRERAGEADPTFEVRVDDALAEGKCVLEVGARRVELTPEAQLAAFEDHLRNGIGTIAPRPAPPLPDVGEAPAIASTGTHEPIVLAEPVPVRRETKQRSVRARTIATDRPDRDDVNVKASPEPAPGPVIRPDREAAEVSRAALAASVEGGDRSTGSAAPVPETAPSHEDGRPRDGTTGSPDQAVPPAVAMDAAQSPFRATVERDGGAIGDEPAHADETEEVAPSPDVADAGAERTTGAKPADEIDFDALELGDGAARFVSAPSRDETGAAPWIGSVVTAPALADVGIQGGGSHAVAALRQRVARSADDLRREVTDAAPASADDAADGRGHRSNTAAADAPTADRPSDEAAPASVAAPSEKMRVDASRSASSGADGTLPPFAHSLRGAAAKEDTSPANASTRPVVSRPARDGDPAADDPAGRVMTGRDGDGVRKALAKARRRTVRADAAPPRAVQDAVANEADEAPVIEADDGRSSRLPPRIAELISRRRSAR